MNDELKEKLQSMRRDPKESPVLVNFENSSMQFVTLSGETHNDIILKAKIIIIG